MNNAEVLIKFKGDTKNVDNSVNGLTKSMGSLTKSITLGNLAAKGISKAFSLISSNVDGAISRFDTLQNFPKVMESLGISAKDADASIKKMSDKLSGLPTTLDAGASAVQRFTAYNGDVKKSTDIFLAVNNAILAGGASMELQSSALEQLTQAYTKGKPEAQDWKTIMQAMPAQLKQIAKTMGYTSTAIGGDFYNALMSGKITMDDFMNTAIKLNEKGGEGFESFSKQAIAGTKGIRTAITNAKTQVVKGITTMIDGLNKGLKKAKLGSISDIIANIGKTAKKVLDNLGVLISKIPFKKVIDALSTIAKIIPSIVAGLIAYKTVTKAITAINMAKNIASTVSSIMNLTSVTSKATKSISALNKVSASNVFGLMIAGAVTLIGSLNSISESMDKVGQKNKQFTEKLKEYDNTMKEIDKQKNESLSKSMNEIYYYQSLYDELKTIVDESGKVKVGYEDRASFITSTLSNALGMEITMTNGIIQNYQSIQTEIDKTMAKKKAMAYLNAYEDKYNTALSKESTLQADIDTAIGNRTDAENKLKQAINDGTLLYDMSTKRKKEWLKYLKGEISLQQLHAKGWSQADSSLKGYLEQTKTGKKIIKEYNDAAANVTKATDKYAENQKIIHSYLKAQEDIAKAEAAAADGDVVAADKHYESAQRRFNDTVTFNGKTEQANDKTYKKEIARWEQYRNDLKSKKDTYDQEYYNSEMARIDNEEKILNDERIKANNILKQKNTDTLNTTITGINDQLSAIEGYNYEFRDAGNGLMQFYANGERQGYPVTIEEAQKVTNGVLKKFNSGKIQAKDIGKQISNGLAVGISSYGAAAIEAARTVSEAVTKEMKKATKVHSPSRVTAEIGKFLVLGLNQGIYKNTNKSIQTIDDYANKVTQAFASGMATNISPQLAATSSLHYSPNVIVNNQMNMRTDPLGQVVGNIKTFANGSKNDYNYGMGS